MVVWEFMTRAISIYAYLLKTPILLNWGPSHSSAIKFYNKIPVRRSLEVLLKNSEANINIKGAIRKSRG